MIETQTNEIKLKEKYYEPFFKITNFYLFEREIQISEDNYEIFLKLAEQYQFTCVKNKCEEWILEHIEDFDNKHELFEFADLFHLDLVKTGMVHAFMQNIKKMKVDSITKGHVK
ncbi:MAG: hypothetical protein ACSNEK_00245 [Parachlamydiaceae bacterium]